MALPIPDSWLAEMKRAGTLAARGVPGAALRILDHLYGDVRAAGRGALGDWHRVQILWVKATILEEAGRYADAARVYETIVRFRRSEMEEAGRGLLSSLVAAAGCKAKGGQRAAATRLARQAKQLLERFPDRDAEALLDDNPTLWSASGRRDAAPASPRARRSRSGSRPRSGAGPKSRVSAAARAAGPRRRRVARHK
jgi:hypothetical protein